GVTYAQQCTIPQPQTGRLRGTIEKLDGRAVLAKSTNDEALVLKLADKVVVAVVKASITDIKPGLFIGSGAIPLLTVRRKRSKCIFSPNPCAGPARDIGRGMALPIPP